MLDTQDEISKLSSCYCSFVFEKQIQQTNVRASTTDIKTVGEKLGIVGVKPYEEHKKGTKSTVEYTTNTTNSVSTQRLVLPSTTEPHIHYRVDPNLTPCSLQRILTPDFPSIKYDPDVLNNNVHWGQKKLLMSEIECLTMILNSHSQLPVTVVYVGGADGRKMMVLQRLFPMVYFILYDPAPFYTELYQLPNVEIHSGEKHGYFKEETCRILKSHPRCNSTKYQVVFMSDIRMSPFEEEVMEDMNVQQRWVELFQPDHILLKFRLPWCDNNESKTFTYLQGDIYTQIWGPKSSTECRLFASKPYVKRQYDCLLYQNQCAYYNTILRSSPCFYKDSIASKYFIAGFDDSFECAVEYFIVEQYLLAMKQDASSSNILTLMLEIHEQMVDLCNRRTLPQLTLFTIQKSREETQSLKDKRKKQLQKYEQEQLPRIRTSIHRQRTLIEQNPYLNHTQRTQMLRQLREASFVIQS